MTDDKLTMEDVLRAAVVDADGGSLAKHLVAISEASNVKVKTLRRWLDDQTELGITKASRVAGVLGLVLIDETVLQELRRRES